MPRPKIHNAIGLEVLVQQDVRDPDVTQSAYSRDPKEPKKRIIQHLGLLCPEALYDLKNGFDKAKGCVMFLRKQKRPPASNYHKGGKIPVIRSSICTGEQVAGFKDPASGKFEELMLIRDSRDFQEFLRRYQVEETEIKREW